MIYLNTRLYLIRVASGDLEVQVPQPDDTPPPVLTTPPHTPPRASLLSPRRKANEDEDAEEMRESASISA